jgi:hypothetical protein
MARRIIGCLCQGYETSLVHPTALADRGADHELEQLVFGKPGRKRSGEVGIGDLITLVPGW